MFPAVLFLGKGKEVAGMVRLTKHLVLVLDPEDAFALSPVSEWSRFAR